VQCITGGLADAAPVHQEIEEGMTMLYKGL